MINTFFFFLWPWFFCCKCCKPLKQKLNLSKVFSRQRGGSNYSSSQYMPCAEESDEETILEQYVEKKRDIRVNRFTAGDSSKPNVSSDSVLNLSNFTDLFEEEDDFDDDETSTRYILQALSESRQTMNKLLSKHSSQKLDDRIEAEQAHFKEADDLVQALLSAQIVYRSFHTPVGNLVNIPAGMKYCMRGYFLPSLGTAYEFVNYTPLAQYICLSPDGRSLAKLHPPAYLSCKHFGRVYKNKYDVLETGDLTAAAPEAVPCLNISPFKIVPESVVKFVLSDRAVSQQLSQDSLKAEENVLKVENEVHDLDGEDRSVCTEILNYASMHERLSQLHDFQIEDE